MESSLLRILDANLNRAREALRVLEDAARFFFRDRATAFELKSMRHVLVRLARPYESLLLSARDARSDVGRESKQARYRSSDDVLRSNFRRFEEAARSIAEYARTVAPALAVPVTRLRFRSYELERNMVAHERRRARLEKVYLYVLLDSRVAGRPLEQVAEETLLGGADAVQLREHGSDREVMALAKRLVKIARRHGAIFLVNDRVDIAAASGADGVHLGKEDMAISEARRILGPEALIGATSHSFSESRSAERAGADYVSVGPMFPSSTKPVLAPRGFRYVRHAVQSLSIPVFCIGGITAGNVRRVIRAGGRRIAVCEGVIGQSNVRRAARILRSGLKVRPSRSS